eukprot:TRINITY_DN3625_c0_g1_i1.p1 TRINITY_DN3625_c0_g1~~TRINITY_DN3625_c0_g1_i1.p1  ORF type:complete len:240 (-),score=31.94 TRINITY_DN3625_c0_g1_i1:659-1336(-)
MKIILCLTLCFCIHSVISTMILDSPTNQTFEGTFTVVNVFKQFDSSSEIVNVSGVISQGMVSGYVYYNISNFIVLDIEDTPFIFFEGSDIAVVLQDLGARWILIQEKIIPPGRRYIIDRPRPLITAPVFALDVLTRDVVYGGLNESIGAYAMVYLTPDYNTWEDFKGIMLFFHGLLLVLAGIPIAMNVAKIINISHILGCSVDVSLVALAFILVSDLCRAVAIFF